MLQQQRCMRLPQIIELELKLRLLCRVVLQNGLDHGMAGDCLLQIDRQLRNA